MRAAGIIITVNEVVSESHLITSYEGHSIVKTILQNQTLGFSSQQLPAADLQLVRTGIRRPIAAATVLSGLALPTDYPAAPSRAITIDIQAA